MKYLACLSTSSSNDKLSFDVGLQEHSHGEACWWTLVFHIIRAIKTIKLINFIALTESIQLVNKGIKFCLYDK